MSKLVKAELRQIKWNDSQQAQEIKKDKTIVVQFNPETLKVAFANQSSGGDQRGGSAIQFVGAGTTKLSLDLIFDVTAPLPGDEAITDVRKLTEKVNYFIKPEPTSDRQKWIPPGVRFIWGTFLFDGIMDSMNETLEYFSEDGVPLRAAVSISLSSQTIQFQFGAGGSGGNAGESPLNAAKDNQSVQQMAAESGQGKDWKNIAAANNIENPRLLAPGTLVDLNAGASLSAGASISGGASFGAGGVSLNASAPNLATAVTFDASVSVGLGGAARIDL